MSSSRSVTFSFYAMAVVGIVLSTGLAVQEAGHQPPITIDDVTHERVEDRLEIQARVTNASKERRCPEIRAVARDRDDRDLAESVALSDAGDVPIEPDRSAIYRARITGLTEEEHTEKLADVRLYVFTTTTC